MFADLMSLCTLAAAPALPQDWWNQWSLAPAIVLPLLAAFAWAVGSRIMPMQRALRTAGCLFLAIALLSPLCRLAATLVSAHMVQLTVLMIAAPALMALGAHPALLGQHRRTDGERSSARAIGASTLLYGGLIWLWHVPAIYAATLNNPVVHWIAYAALCVVSLWFWHSSLHAPPAERGRAVLALVLTTFHTGLLGALLTFATTPFYPELASGARAWGLDPLEDQQLAGLVMWVPGSMGYLLAGLALALTLLKPSPVVYGLTPENSPRVH